MAIHYIRIGAIENGWGYDDADFPDAGIELDTPIACAAPINSNEVIRLDDLLNPSLFDTVLNSIVMFENEVVGFNNNVVFI